MESDENRSDLVTPDSDTVRDPESEGPDNLDVRSTFVAEVTYKQVVFSSGVPWGEKAKEEEEKEGRGIERVSGGKEEKGGEGGGGEEEEEEEEGPAREGTLSEKEKAEQVDVYLFHLIRLLRVPATRTLPEFFLLPVPYLEFLSTF